MESILIISYLCIYVFILLICFIYINLSVMCLGNTRKIRVNMMKRLIVFATILWSMSALQAQIQDPVKFKTQFRNLKGDLAEIVFTGTINDGWHVYSTDLGKGGPISATFNILKKSGIEPVGKLTAQGKKITVFDKLFQMKVSYFANRVIFVQKVKLLNSKYAIDCYLEYGACNDENCLPPTKVNFIHNGKIALIDNSETKVAISTINTVAQQGTKELVNNHDTTTVSSSKALSLWKPVIKELKAYNTNTGNKKDLSWIYIFFTGFLGGILALFTPCVWPVIPMTVSFFLKRNKDRKKAIKEAGTYGMSIVIIYMLCGIAITLIFGASALNALATNAIFNIIFCLLLVVFAASFMGAFEITLPSKWTNSVDSKADRTSGFISIFLMAFTLTLVSFSCTGPIIGFLLVEVSTIDNIIAPAIGMLGFAIALALPFTLFAMFPSWLKSMPKSGGWMNVVKVVLGFIELAFALKFLSVADLAYGWRILDRETFISLWIVIFALLGLYLLGKIKFKHDDDSTHIGVTRFLLGLITLAFSVYMLPGLWGAPLKAISAFTPPMKTQDFNLYKNDVTAKFDDYDTGMAYAREHHKPVMLDFTGYGCVNCRKMEMAVWTDAKVGDIINNDYVLISLYVDDKKPLPQPMKITESGAERTLYTIGDKWSYLQRVKFGANAQPFYVLLDNNGYPLNGSYSYNENIGKYISFLEKGLANYK